MANKTRQRGVFLAASGLLTVMSLAVAPAWADGVRKPAATAKAGIRTQGSVSVDYGALDAIAPLTQNLLVPGPDGRTPLRVAPNDEPVVLRPPNGVAPVLIPPGTRMSNVGNIALVKLRPPPGVRVTDLPPAAPVEKPV